MDSHEVTALEREEAIQQSQFLAVVTYKDEDDQNLASNEEKANNLYTPLANSNELGTSDDPKGKFFFNKEKIFFIINFLILSFIWIL